MVTAYDEMVDSPIEDYTTDSFSATRRLMVDWGSRYALVTDLQWLAYPYLPGVLAYPSSMSVVPAKAKQLPCVGTDFVTYEKAIVTVHYLASAKDPSTLDLVTESLEPNAELRTLDFEDFRWGAINGDVLKEDEAPSQLLRGHDYVLTFHNALAVPLSVITLEGYVNAANFSTYTLGLTYPPETLLFAGGSPSRKITSDGADTFKLTERFQYKASGWNKFFRQSTKAFESIFHKTGGIHRNNPLGDFNTLKPA